MSFNSQLEHDRAKAKKVSYRYTQSEVLRGARIPIRRLSPMAPKLLPNLRKLLKSHLSKPRQSSFGQSVLSSYYHQTAKIDKETWVLGTKRNRDSADVSTHPSYNIMNFQYDLNCYVRYLEAKEKYDKQLMLEMENCINSRRSIGEQYFTRSFFSYTTLWPPLHTKTEIDYFYKNFFQLTSNQKKRLKNVMNTNFSVGC